MMLSAYLHSEVMLALTGGALVDDEGTTHVLTAVAGVLDAVSSDFVRLHVGGFVTTKDQYSLDEPVELVVAMRYIASCQLLGEGSFTEDEDEDEEEER